jgi:enoyl-[acyl-carrier protein] reductase II
MARRIAGEGYPVAAAGGISTGRTLVAAMALGADGVWMGTRFVATAEAHARAGYKEALVAAPSAATVVTRAYSGKPMRVLRNNWVDDWERRGVPPHRFREQLRESLDAGVMSMLAGPGGHPSSEFDPARECMPAGQAVGAIEAIVPAAQVVRDLIREAAECSGLLTTAFTTHPSKEFGR